jgi:hypothetical protein
MAGRSTRRPGWRCRCGCGATSRRGCSGSATSPAASTSARRRPSSQRTSRPTCGTSRSTSAAASRNGSATRRSTGRVLGRPRPEPALLRRPLAHYVTQAGASLYLGGTNTARQTFSTSARCGLTDFNGKVWAIHPPTASTRRRTGSPGRGRGFAEGDVDRLLAEPADHERRSGQHDPGVASAIGDGTDWSTGGRARLEQRAPREPERRLRVLSVRVRFGVDIAARPGLIACKRDSTYRLYDSSTGAYQTLDPNIGAASAKSVTTSSARRSSCRGRGSSGRTASPRCRRRRHGSTRCSRRRRSRSRSSTCARPDRSVIAATSRCRGSGRPTTTSRSSTTRRGLDHAGSNAATCYATYANVDAVVYTGSPTVSGQVYQQLSGGADDGAAIASWFQTNWFEPTEGFFTRFRLRENVGARHASTSTRARTTRPGRASTGR